MRDENGWHVPAEGTQGRRVYDLLKAGESEAAINALLEDVSKNVVYVTAYKIKYPESEREWARNAYLRRWHPVDPRCKVGVEIFSPYTGFGVVDEVSRDHVVVIAADGERVMIPSARYKAMQYDMR